jgi:hypothetical protein
MYRRRRPHREQIAFGFDCFLDVVANVIGIIVRLILVAWVGARSYTATMKWTDESPPSEQPAPQVTDDPLHAEMEFARVELDEARKRLLAQLDELDGTRQRTEQAKAQLGKLAEQRRAVETEADKLGETRARREGKVKQVALSLDDLRQRGQKLLQEIKSLEGLPAKTKVLRYHAPLSRAVYDDQVRFECRGRRVTFIDMTALVEEIRSGMSDHIRQLRTQWSISSTTSSIGAFRLRYTLMRERTPLEAAVGGRGPSASSGFQLNYRFVLEPIVEQRGETLDAALAAGSEFRQLVDRLDPRLTVVTFHVYPDSYGLFRQLRDHLYERGIEVAGSPQPEGEPVTFSPNGVISRGQ